MSKFDAREYLKNKYRKPEEDDDNVSKYSSETNQTDKFDARKYMQGKRASSEFELDTLESDLISLGTTINNIYNEWQTPETMKNTLSSVESMYNRLNTYGEFQKKYGGADLSEITNAYKTTIDNWGDLTEAYSGFQNADAFNVARKKAQLSKKFEGLSYGDVQARLRRYDADSDEYNFLKTYTQYTDLKEFDKALENATDKKSEYYDNLQKARNVYAQDHTFDLFKDVMQNEDFEKYSKYSEDAAGIKIGFDGGINSIADKEYAYINNPSGFIRDPLLGSPYEQSARDWIKGQKRLYGADTKNDVTSFEKKGYDQLKPEEVSVYNYLAYHDKINGTNKAREFLDAMEQNLTKRVYGEEKTQWKDTVDRGVIPAALMSALTVPATLFGGAYNIAQRISDVAEGKGYNPYGYYNTLSNFASDTTKYTSENIEKATEGMELFGQNIPSFAYNVGMSRLNSAVGGAFLGSWHTLLMGSNAYQEKARELFEEGEDGFTTQGNAMVSGALEVAMEKIGFEKLMNMKNADSPGTLIWNMLKQGGAEAGEEFGTSLGNIGADLIFRRKNSEYVKKYNDLIERGFSKKDAILKTGASALGELAWSAVGGFAGGFGVGGAYGIDNYREMSSTGKNIRSNERVGDMLSLASTMTPDEASAYEAYTRYAKKGINADNITDAQLGNLYHSTKAEATKGLFSKDTTVERQKRALTTKNKLNEIDNDNLALKEAKANTQSGKENKSNFTTGEVTEVASTGNSATIQGIKVDGDNTTLITTEGEVKSSDMNFSTRDADLVGHAQFIAKEHGNDVGNVFLQQYDGKTDVNEYAEAFNLVMTYADKNYTQDTILARKGILSAEQATEIYKATVHQQFEAQQKAVDAIVERQGKSMTIKGTFDDSIIDRNSLTTDGSKVNWNTLTTRQRSAINFARMFSKATGVNIRLIQSEVVDGKRKGENGNYDPETNTISIDVYAGIIDAKSVNDSIIPTLTHEITHWAKAKASSIYETLRNDVMKTLAENDGITSEERIANELARLKEAHPEQEFAEEDAIDEIIARACEDMLSNSNYARKLLNKMSPKEQKKFRNKIKETFDNLMQWVNDLLAQYKSSSYEAEVLRRYKDKIQKISKTWDSMIESAVGANQALQREGVLGETLINGISKDGTTIVGDKAVQMSERTYREGGRDFLKNWLDNQEDLSDDDKKDILDQTDAIANLMKSIREGNDLPEYSKWANMEVVKDENGEKVLSVIVKNGDYAMNIDFSQVCKKRVALNAVLNAMVQSGDLNVYTLTETDVADLNAIIKKHEFEIACALCFVDSKRYRVGSWAESFCEGSEKKKNGKMVHQYGFNEMVRSLVPKGSNIKIDEFNFTGRDIVGQPTTNLLSEMDDSELDFTLIDEIMAREKKADGKSTDLYAYAKAIRDNKDIRKILNPAEIISSIGLDNIRLESPEVYRLINRHQGTARPKFSHDIVAYGNDILKAKNFTAEKAKMVGGVRCQSFSDFMANMVMDYAQFISELSAKQLTAHTYTKEPLFVKLFGLTGMKINMSLVPKAIDMTPEQQKKFAILKDKNANKHSPEYKQAKAEYDKFAVNAGLDENGNYIWEDETFPYDIAMDIVVDPRYSANCGTIAVGISDRHILKLLDDDRISMVIPYHKSGLNHDVAIMRDIALYKDYTNTQRTRFANGKKLEKTPDFDFYGDLYGTDGKEGTHDPKTTADNYLKWCDEHNYIPKFEVSTKSRKFRDNPNYYKLLTDFRVYDTDGTYREQQPVKTIYPSNDEFKDLILNGVTDKDGKVYGGLKQQQASTDKLSTESQQIIDEYRDVLKEKYGKDVLKKKNSDRDSNGNTLTDKQVEFFKDSKVRDADGNLRVMYHGTPTGGFTEFKLPHYLSPLTSAQGAGYYFTDKRNAKQYTKALNGKSLTKKQLYEVYLNITNPLEISEHSEGAISDDAFRRIMARGNYKWGMEHTDVEQRLQVSRFDSERLAEMVRVFNGEEILNVMKEELGYDGVHFTDHYGDIWVAWDSNQIKSVDNTNPTQSNNIHYSDRIKKDSAHDLMGEGERLEKENAKLKADVERLRERLALEKKVTNGNHFNENQLNAVANHLRTISKSTFDKASIVTALREIYSYIAHSPNLTWNEVFDMSYSLAETMLTKTKPEVEVNDFYKHILKDIKSARISLDNVQKGEAEARYGKNYNRYFFGKIVIAKDGIPLDTKWQEWASQYPGIFDAESTDQVGDLFDIINKLHEASEVVVEYDAEEQARWLANEIYNQYWNVSTIKTTADKYDKKLRLLNFEHRRVMTELREDYNTRMKERLEAQKLVDDMHYKRKLRESDKKAKEQTEKVKLAYDMHYGRLLRNLEVKAEQRLDKTKAQAQEKFEQYKENAERKTRIQSITSTSFALSEMLVKNSKDKHVPEVLKGPVITLLNAIDFSSKKLLDKNIPTNKDISLSKALSKVKDMMKDASDGNEELTDLYGHGMDDDIKALVESVDDIMRTIGDNEFILNKMTLSDLKTLEKMVKTIKFAVNKVNKFHVVNHAKGIANLSQESMLHLDSLGKGKIYDGKKGLVKKLLDWGNALPYYVFKRYGSGGMKVYEALQNGWDNLAFNVKKIMDYAKETYTSEEVKAWEKEIKTFKILIPATEAEMEQDDYEPQYQTIQMTVPQIMSIYCLYKREQARKHLFQGGIRVADFKNAKGEIVSQSDGVIFTEKDIPTILDSLTDRQKNVADKLQEFMNTVCSEWGNEVSMLRFGYKAFGEENYFPVQSDKNNLAVNDETEQNNSLFSLLNMSFTKSLNDNANNRIVISNIFDVFAQHTSDMAKYNALALPVLDAFKWYNYTEKQPIADGTFRAKGVKQSIEYAFGKDGQNYFTTFLKDINGQQEVSRDTLGKGFFSNSKIAAVAANLRVVLLQPTSYFRASAVIDNKYLAKAFRHKPKIKMAETHCGIALWKSMGYFDTNIQRGIESQIKHDETLKDKIVDKSMKGAEIADKITWGYLWNACELEVRDKQKELKVGTEEFYQAIAHRLREVIYATQVVDSTMTRSHMMRSNDRLDKMLTAFASEPTLSYNMVQDAFMEYSLDKRKFGKKEALHKNKKRIARILTAYTVTNAIAALVESGFDALRDDDDEEMDVLAFMKLYLNNFSSDMSITGKIPYIKEIHSIVRGFSSSRSDTQWMEHTTNALIGWWKIFNGKGSASSVIKNSLKSTSEIVGLPFYNVYRDAMSVLNKLDLFTTEDLNEMFEDFFE